MLSRCVEGSVFAQVYVRQTTYPDAVLVILVPARARSVSGGRRGRLREQRCCGNQDGEGRAAAELHRDSFDGRDQEERRVAACTGEATQNDPRSLGIISKVRLSWAWSLALGRHDRLRVGRMCGYWGFCARFGSYGLT